MNVIISPVFSFGGVSYGTYDAAGRMSIFCEYGRDVYTKGLKNSHQKQYHMKIRYCVCGVRKQDTLFDAMEFQKIYHENTFSIGDTCLNVLSKHV